MVLFFLFLMKRDDDEKKQNRLDDIGMGKNTEILEYSNGFQNVNNKVKLSFKTLLGQIIELVCTSLVCL